VISAKRPVLAEEYLVDEFTTPAHPAAETRRFLGRRRAATCP